MSEMQQAILLLTKNLQNTQEEVKEIKSSVQNLEKHVTQIATAVGRLENQGRLPSQTEANPRQQNVSALTLRSGRQLREPVPKPSHPEENDPNSAQQGRNNSAAPKATNALQPEKEKELEAPPASRRPTMEERMRAFDPKPPFPERFAQDNKEREEREILEQFKRVELNIPLLEAIKRIPKYAKVLKSLCTNKRRHKGYEKLSVGGAVSAAIQRNLPTKCEDKGMFSIPCTIGGIEIGKAMCDLGASINVMSETIYHSLGAGPLKESGNVIQLADGSIVHPKGIVEDVLVQVKDVVFPADFFILDMGDTRSPNSSDILLGRPFLSTARAKIDVHEGTLTFEFDGDVIQFNVYDSLEVPTMNNKLEGEELKKEEVSVCELWDHKPAEKSEHNPYLSLFPFPWSKKRQKPARPCATPDLKQKFHLGQRVSICEAKMKQFTRRCRKRWKSPWEVIGITPLGKVQIQNLEVGKTLKVDEYDLELHNGEFNCESQNVPHDKGGGPILWDHPPIT